MSHNPKIIKKLSKVELPFTFYDDVDVDGKLGYLFRYPTQEERRVMKVIFKNQQRVQEYVVHGKYHTPDEPLNYSCFTIHIPFKNYPIYTHIIAHANPRDLESAVKEMLSRLGLYWDVSLAVSYGIFCPKSGGNTQIYYVHEHYQKSMNSQEFLEKKYRFFFRDEHGDKDVVSLNNMFAEENNKGKLTTLCLYLHTAWTASWHNLAFYPADNVRGALTRASDRLPDEADPQLSQQE